MFRELLGLLIATVGLLLIVPGSIGWFTGTQQSTRIVGLVLGATGFVLLAIGSAVARAASRRR
jgi:drug/metabolite transporter (DMT)-like permease